MNNISHYTKQRRYHFEIRHEQRTPGIVEAGSKKEAQDRVEAGLADFGDEYYTSTSVHWLNEQGAGK